MELAPLEFSHRTRMHLRVSPPISSETCARYPSSLTKASTPVALLKCLRLLQPTRRTAVARRQFRFVSVHFLLPSSVLHSKTLYRTSIRTRSSKSTRRLNMSRLSFALVLLVPRCSRRSISSRVPTYSRPVRQRTRFCRTRRKCTCGTARVSWMKSRRRWRRGGLDSFLRMRSIFSRAPERRRC